MCAAVFPLLGSIAVFIDGINIGLNPLNLRFRIEPSVTRGDQGLLHVTYRPHHVSTFVLAV